MVYHQNKASRTYICNATALRARCLKSPYTNSDSAPTNSSVTIIMPSSKGKPTDPKLREKVKEDVKQETNKDGGGKGQMSAWKVSSPTALKTRVTNNIFRVKKSPRSMRRKEAHTRTSPAPRTSQRREHPSPNHPAKRSQRRRRPRRNQKARRPRTRTRMSKKRLKASKSRKPTAARRRIKLLPQRKVQPKLLPRARLRRRRAHQRVRAKRRRRARARAAG